MGIALQTPVGMIIHTGDFKFDHTPVDGKPSDFAILAEFGAEGVLCLLSDSTRAENPGYTPSERTVGEAFREIMEGLEGRVIVATFASNIARVQQVFDAAADVQSEGRRHRPVDGAERPHRHRPRLPEVRPGADRVQGQDQGHPGDKLCIATTGAQGEPMAGLARMANRDHRWVEIEPADTVIVSASPIPGNEESVGRTIDNLFKDGANVFYHTIKRAHVSGHASQEELKLMLDLTRPKYFIPIHGEFRMLVQHGRLAVETGRRAGEHLHHRERQADRVLRRRLAPAAASRSRPARSSSTACRSARSARSSCATAARSRRTACSWSSSPSTSRPARSSASPRS